MAQAVDSSTIKPTFQRELSAGDPPHFIHAESVYLESKTSQSITDDAYMSQPPHSSRTDFENAPSDMNAKPQKTRREERQLRLAEEQVVWLRHKFSLPATDQLLTSFSAALLRHILLQGRMYITTSRICFYTRIFGKVTKESFLFSSLARVEKRRGGLVANAIKIYFEDQSIPPIVIGSLNHREKAFEVIQGRLRELNPDAAKPKETDGDYSYPGCVVSAPDDLEESLSEGNDPNTTSNHHVHPNQLTGSNLLSANLDQESRSSAPLSNNQSCDSDSSASNCQEALVPQDQHCTRDFQTELEHRYVWQTPDDMVDRLAANAFSKKSERVRGTLNAPIKAVFNVLFVSEWLRNYHDAVSNREVTFTKWRRGTDGFMSRDVNFRRPMGYKIGPKETRVREKHRYSFTSNGGAIVEITTESLDAPYGSSFVCESFYELHSHGDGSQTLLVGSLAVHFVKDLWALLQSKIESGALSETKATFQRMFQLATLRIDEYAAELHSKRQTCEAIVNLDKPVRFSSGMKISRDLTKAVRLGTPDERPVENAVVEVDRQLLKSSSDVREAPSCERDRLSVDDVGSYMGDLNVSKWVKIALGTLIVICLVLVGVLLRLNRLQQSVCILESTIERKYIDVANQVCGNKQAC